MKEQPTSIKGLSGWRTRCFPHPLPCAVPSPQLVILGQAGGRELVGAVVGRWDEARHLSAMADPSYAYFLVADGATAWGFAIVRDWGSIEKVTCIKRIAVTSPGKGVGSFLLRRVVAAIYSETEAYRVWLGVFPDNERARKSYADFGFKAEGVARGNAYFGGVHRDELIMSILRPEWTEANRKAVRVQ